MAEVEEAVRTGNLPRYEPVPPLDPSDVVHYQDYGRLVETSKVWVTDYQDVSGEAGPIDLRSGRSVSRWQDELREVDQGVFALTAYGLEFFGASMSFKIALPDIIQIQALASIPGFLPDCLMVRAEGDAAPWAVYLPVPGATTVEHFVQYMTDGWDKAEPRRSFVSRVVDRLLGSR